MRRARESARMPAACLAPAAETAPGLGGLWPSPSLEGVWEGVVQEDVHPEEPHPPPFDRGPLGEASSASLPSQLGSVHEGPPLERTVIGAGLSAGTV